MGPRWQAAPLFGRAQSIGIDSVYFLNLNIAANILKSRELPYKYWLLLETQKVWFPQYSEPWSRVVAPPTFFSTTHNGQWQCPLSPPSGYCLSPTFFNIRSIALMSSAYLAPWAWGQANDTLQKQTGLCWYPNSAHQLWETDGLWTVPEPVSARGNGTDPPSAMFITCKAPSPMAVYSRQSIHTHFPLSSYSLVMGLPLFHQSLLCSLALSPMAGTQHITHVPKCN